MEKNGKNMLITRYAWDSTTIPRIKAAIGNTE
jgi:hypothetical protein